MMLMGEGGGSGARPSRWSNLEPKSESHETKTRHKHAFLNWLFAVTCVTHTAHFGRPCSQCDRVLADE